MPWKETCSMTEKMKFVISWQNQEFTFSELCRSFNISRKTGYKWISRFEAGGVHGLEPQSRAHSSYPLQTDKRTQKILLDLKHRYPTWGPRKIRDWLEIERPNEEWPAASTIGELFKKHGLVKPRKKRHKTPPHSQPFLTCDAPNRIWSADFKGQFRVGTGQLCYPLTITDNYSRFLLACRGFKKPQGLPVYKCFEEVFMEHGLPDAIRTDNGTPFASPGLGGLSKLSVWWIKLGITPERIKPGEPQQNGRHERMHRTLKEDTAKPPKSTLRTQQNAFNRFKEIFNYERPHESLNKKRPSDEYHYSKKSYPTKVPEIEYGNGYEIRVVRHNGEIKWKGKRVFISEVLHGEPVGLKEVNEGLWQLYFSKHKLGILNAKKGRVIRPA